MRKYEVMFIINASVTEDVRTALIEKLHTIITADGGSVDNVDLWGMKEFAYPINHMTKGYYVVSNFTATTEAVKEFDRVAGIEHDIIRHMMIKVD
jgi:small subunit ribosomal protein S6